MTGRIHTTARFWPLVVIVFEDGFDEAALRQCLEEHAAILRLGVPFATVRDLRRMKHVPSSKLRRIGLDWQGEMSDEIASCCVGVANIVPHMVVRSGLRAVHALRRPLCPEAVFPNWTGAVEWSATQLVQAGAEALEPLERIIEFGRSLAEPAATND